MKPGQQRKQARQPDDHNKLNWLPPKLTQCQKDPPQPVLAIEVIREVGGKLDKRSPNLLGAKMCSFAEQPLSWWTGGGVHFSALTLTIRTHLMRDRPKPEMAPYRPAADDVKQNDKKKPIQLKRNATDGGKKGGELRQNYSLHPNPFKLKALKCICKWLIVKKLK